MSKMNWQIVDGLASEGWISWESLSQNVKVGICFSVSQGFLSFGGRLHNFSLSKH